MSAETHPPISSPDISAGAHPSPEHDWDYTVAFVASHGSETYKGRPLIGRDSAIDGGVYFGNYEGEAIVVDTEKYPDPYEQLLADLKDRSTQNGVVKKSLILNSAFNVVAEKMQYSQEGVDRIVDDLSSGEKIDLAEFINAGVGVCRHQALVLGVLLERMKKDGYIGGQVSVDRSKGWSPRGEREGHAWVRYTGSTGDVVILDVAQNKIMLLEDVDPSVGWNYLRPEEQKRFAEGVDALDGKIDDHPGQLKGKLLDNKPVDERSSEQTEQNLSSALQAIKDQFDEETQLNLWRYAAYRLNGEEAGAIGNYVEKSNALRVSQDGYRALTPQAKAHAEDYLGIFRKLHPPKK